MMHSKHAQHLLKGHGRGDRGSHMYGWQRALTAVASDLLETHVHEAGLLKNC